jgi:hypothetical protein
MLGINRRHIVVTVAVAAGLLAAAGPAGASVYQHNQTDLEFLVSSPGAKGAGITDGTSNTVVFGERAATPIGMADMGGRF